jgi:hypothetical protein
MKSGNDRSLFGVAIIRCGHSHKCGPHQSRRDLPRISVSIRNRRSTRGCYEVFFDTMGTILEARMMLLKQVAVLKRRGGICNGHPDKSY